jgi:hypothetical protein
VSGRGGTGWITFSVFGLVVMATWTLVIKFLAPVLYFAAEIAGGRPPDGIPIMWDFWWVAHLALAWSLWRRHVWAWGAGVMIAAVEIVIVVSKFAIYLQTPDWSFWRLLWFTNKAYVLAFFVLLLVLLLRPAARAGLRRSDAPRS